MSIRNVFSRLYFKVEDKFDREEDVPSDSG